MNMPAVEMETTRPAVTLTRHVLSLVSATELMIPKTELRTVLKTSGNDKMILTPIDIKTTKQTTLGSSQLRRTLLSIPAPHRPKPATANAKKIDTAMQKLVATARRNRPC